MGYIGGEYENGASELLARVQRSVNAGANDGHRLAILAARDDGGFHWRDDTYFKRMPDGSVRIRTWRAESHRHDAWPVYEDRIIPAAEWASIVCSVSAQGETGDRWNAAQDFHGRP